MSMYSVLMTEYKYRYENSKYVNETDEDVSREDVFSLLFEGTASGTPALNYELNAINNQVSSETFELVVREVRVREESDSRLILEVRSPSMTVTAPAGQPDHDLRVLHNNDIPYDHYQVSLLN